MKTLFPTFIAALFTLSLHAQDSGSSEIRTLFKDQGHSSRGGFFSISTGYTQALRSGGMLVGGQGGWMIGHGFTIGGGGYGLVSRVQADPYDEYLRSNGVLARASTIEFGYGGVFAEAVVNYRAPVHITFPLLIGYGGCSINAVPVSDHLPAIDAGVRSQGFFVVQPGARVELNVAEHARVSLGVDYRYTSDIYLTSLPADALRGFNGMMTIKVGRF